MCDWRWGLSLLEGVERCIPNTKYIFPDQRDPSLWLKLAICGHHHHVHIVGGQRLFSDEPRVFRPRENLYSKTSPTNDGRVAGRRGTDCAAIRQTRIHWSTRGAFQVSKPGSKLDLQWISKVIVPSASDAISPQPTTYGRIISFNRLWRYLGKQPHNDITVESSPSSAFTLINALSNCLVLQELWMILCPDPTPCAAPASFITLPNLQHNSIFCNWIEPGNLLSLVNPAAD